MTQQIKPISAAQTNRIQAMIDRGIYSGSMPSTSWEASWVIRTSAASKRDKDQLKALGGRVLARMTSSEVEMTSKVLQALSKISAAGSKDESIIEAEILLRHMFCSKAQ
jgi:hypothetical protein